MKRTFNPINTFLLDNSKKNKISFHMPGHSNGKGFLKDFKKNILKYDITEIPNADNLHNVNGIIKESLLNISNKVNSDDSFYLVNGSSSGIHAVLKYISFFEKSVVVARDSHLSIYNSAILFKLDLKFIGIDFLEKMQVPMAVKSKDVEQVIKRNSEKFIIITSPNYYGLCANVKKISKIVHKHNKILIIDHAHGAHFIHSKHLNNEIMLYADIVIESVHKTLPSLNQGALIHINKKRIDVNLLKDCINFVTTTSPSYPLLASMEMAILKDRNSEYDSLYIRINRFKETLKNTIYTVLKNDDFTRIVINISKTGKTGYEVLDILSENGIDIETANYSNIVLIATPYNTKKDFKKLYNSLNRIKAGELKERINIKYSIPKKKMKIYETYNFDKRSISIDKAKGKICGTIIIAYPPGIPILCNGEIIDDSTLKIIKKLKKINGLIVGLDNNRIEVLDTRDE